MRCLSCDFGGSSVKYALVDDEANITNSSKLPAPLDTPEHFVETVGLLYDQYRDQIDGIAISMPGYIDPGTGTLYDAGAYMQLYGRSIVELLTARCPVPITVENDGKCAALAEAWKGSLKDCRDAAVLILGSGIAGGIIKDGKIHSGRDFAAGEFSYIITDPTQANDMGCAYMSAAMHGLTYHLCKAKNLDLAAQDCGSILKMIDDRLNVPYAHPEEPLKYIRADGVTIFRWLDEGDADAAEAYRIFINGLAVVVHSVQICFAPEKIAIGGGLSLENRIFSDLQEELKRYYKGMHLGRQLHAHIVKSRYLNECNLIGATYNFLLRNSHNGIANA